MSYVQFEEDPIGAPRQSLKRDRPSFLTGLFIKTGVVKTAKGAQILMLILALLTFAITFSII